MEGKKRIARLSGRRFWKKAAHRCGLERVCPLVVAHRLDVGRRGRHLGSCHTPLVVARRLVFGY